MAVVYTQGGPKDVTGNGHYMETQAWLDTNNGHMEAITQVWSSNWVFGFTGSVGMLYFDGNGIPLMHSQGAEFGVDARGVPWSASSRTEKWTHDIDLTHAARVAQMLLVHSYAPRQRLQDILSEVVSYGQTAVEFCRTHPEVCIAVGGFF